jgi:hypothetical protein
MKRIIIALTGAAGAGKDTVADFLVRRHGFTKMAFADILRAEICQAFNLDSDGRLLKRQIKEIPMLQLKLIHCSNTEFIEFATQKLQWDREAYRSPREMIQTWGDFRRGQSQDYVVDALTARIAATPGHIAVSDCRFDKEAAALSGKPFSADIWFVENPHTQTVRSHSSEKGIDQYFIDRYLDNSGSIQDLYELTEFAFKTVLYGAEAPCATSSQEMR